MSAPALAAPRFRAGFRRFGLLGIGGFLVLVFVVSAIFAPEIAPDDPYALDVNVMLQGPSPAAPAWAPTSSAGISCRGPSTPRGSRCRWP